MQPHGQLAGLIPGGIRMNEKKSIPKGYLSYNSTYIIF
jgi:hypothetical protein